jgi:uncharacterized protein with ATP-grasp and redox domains
MATSESQVHEEVLRWALRTAAAEVYTTSPPLLGREIHRVIREKSGNPDPYGKVKRYSNQAAMSLYGEMKKPVRGSEWPFETAVRLAVPGNIIDFALISDPREIPWEEMIEDTLSRELSVDDTSLLEKDAGEARSILYLADNAGEIVFDRILIEELPVERLVLAVRGSPVINDATMEDAEAAGLTDIVEVIDNGSDAPGTILEDCSQDFKHRFDDADLVIAKGQGNYETLNEIRGSDLYFLLKAKCPVIADEVGCRQGDIVVKRSVSQSLVQFLHGSREHFTELSS